jgi:uncharacterized protein (DUF1800 family)
MENSPVTDAKMLNKIAYGHTAQDLKQLEKLGLKNYIEEQLNPDDTKEAPMNAGSVSEHLTAVKIQVEYNDKGKKMNEARGIQHLNKSQADLWRELYHENISFREKFQPAVEVMAHTWVRAVYSRWQLREIMVLFWHNHFNVNVTKDERIALTLPAYDRDVIRQHAFGNFRTLLEAVAQSPAMLYYLNNASSQASPANENYARELFELHTLGRDAYLNNLYNRWREVPGATEGKPTGYIDEDVYEAARAFTGWTVADGSDNGKGNKLPNTGAFHYYEGWHDNYQKRILGVELPPNQAPLMDGKAVLDLVAYHPATARHICKKLCQRFISDAPTEGVIQKAVEVFIKNQKAPDQIKRVVRTILLSDECLNSAGQKTKTPFELVASFLRTSAIDFSPTMPFFWLMNQTGYTLFEWQTPTGHPDRADYWLNANMMLARWNIINVCTADWQKFAKWDVKKALPSYKEMPITQLADLLIKKHLNTESAFMGGLKLKTAVAHFIADGGSIDEPSLHDEKVLEQKIMQAIALIGMSPEFQVR